MQDKRCFTYPWFVVLDNIVLFSDDCTSAWQLFWYEKNLQGDVVAVYDNNGVKQVSYVYDAWGNITTTYHNGGASTGAYYNPIRYRSYYYDREIELYCLGTRWYSPRFHRFMSPDDISYLGANGDLNSYNLYAYCSNNPVNMIDPTGNFAISLTMLGLIIGAVIGAFAGGVIAYNVAKDNGAEGWDLFGWTMLGVTGGGLIGGAIGAGIGALITKLTGVVGFSVTKHSVVPVKKITLLGHDPGYVTAAKNMNAGFYRISDDLYDALKTRGNEWTNNMKYLKDANALRTKFVLNPDFIVLEQGTLWKEIQYLVCNGIPWIMY